MRSIELTSICPRRSLDEIKVQRRQETQAWAATIREFVAPTQLPSHYAIIAVVTAPVLCHADSAAGRREPLKCHYVHEGLTVLLLGIWSCEPETLKRLTTTSQHKMGQPRILRAQVGNRTVVAVTSSIVAIKSDAIALVRKNVSEHVGHAHIFSWMRQGVKNNGFLSSRTSCSR